MMNNQDNSILHEPSKNVEVPKVESKAVRLLDREEIKLVGGADVHPFHAHGKHG